MWATWCPPCRASLPHLDKLYEETKDKGVTIYAVNLQEEKDDVQNFIKQTNLKTPVLLDSDGAVAQAYHANAIPQTMVIGKDGKVVKIFVGFSGDESAKELKQTVEKALK
jgi:peroxiredoxin